jgi:hypothetical protein
MTLNDIENALGGLGYTLKRVTNSRVAIVTDKRQAAMDHVMEIFKNQKPQLMRDAPAIRISSLGVIKVDRFQIITKPASKNVLKAEQEATDSLIQLIKDACDQEGKSIDINIGRHRLNNCDNAGSNQIKGDPKADIAIIDDRGNEVGFISHKKEGGAKAFQQYGGISSSAGSNIYNDKIVQDFVKDLREMMQTKFSDDRAKAGFSAFRYVPNTRAGQQLVSRSVYGPDWTEGRKFNRQSVHCIGQGSPILTRQQNGSYNLTFSESTHYANEYRWAFQGDYKAILAVTYRIGRKVQTDGITLKDVRGGIYPYDFIRSRKSTEI